MRPLMILYHLGWSLAYLGCLPVALLRKDRHLSDRLGLTESLPQIREGSVWIHALSVGEVISAVPLVDALRSKVPEKDIVFSVSTAKGMQVAGDTLAGKVKALVSMPVDCWWPIRRLAKRLRPSVFVLVETDLWPGILDYFRQRGIRCILVNGRISPRTFRSYRKFPFLARNLFKGLDRCLMQSALDTRRLLEVGVPPEKVKTAGNIKFDREWRSMGETEYTLWLRHLRLERTVKLWVAGSTHRGEESTVLDVFKRLRPSFSELRLIIAPRKVAQAGDVVAIASDRGLKAILRTEIQNSDVLYDILVLDTIGELERIYGLGQVAFVGGSLVPFGGHNLLEPASFGCPVLYGPHTHNFVSMAETMEESGAGWRVRDGDELYLAVSRLLIEPEKREKMGMRSRKFVEESRGALERVVSSIAYEL